MRALPLYFGSAIRPLFGWIHLPVAPTMANVGVVICQPVGYDAVSSHRTLRHLAQELASIGVCALRFDYDGTGDSAGTDTDPDRVEAWTESVRAAATELVSRTGVERVCLVGIRFGATLAVRAAERIPNVSACVMINPVSEGRRFLRELKALASTGAAIGQPVGQDSDGIQAAAGFVTTAETRAAIGALSLSALGAVPRQVLLMDRTDLPIDDGLAARFEALGASVSRLPFPGYAEMLHEPHESFVPQQALEGITDWMLKQAVSGTQVRAPFPVGEIAHARWFDEESGAHIEESAVRIDERSGLFGILTRPAASTGSVLVLLNAGSIHRVGPNRLYVRLARRLARCGMSVLRIDLPGLGDSPVLADDAENLPYPDDPIPAVVQALEYARTCLGASDVSCAGICSGAYHSLKVAVENQKLAKLLVVNPLTFFWKPGMDLSAPVYRDTAELARYQRTVLSIATLRKVLKGEVSFAAPAAVVARSTARRIRFHVRNAARILGIPLKDDLALELRQIDSQGTRIHFVFSEHDPGYPMLLEEAASDVRRLMDSGALTINLIRNSDHTFTPLPAQAALIEEVVGILVPSGPGNLR